MENTESPSNTTVADTTPTNPIVVTPTVFLNTGGTQWYESMGNKKNWLYGSVFLIGSVVLLVIFSLMGIGGSESEEMDFNSAPPKEFNSVNSGSGGDTILSASGNSSALNFATGEVMAEKEVRKIFKIKTYVLGVDGSYTYHTYGSAINVGENRILTNAHNLLGSDKLPTGKYNLCVTEVDTSIEKCVTPLRLIKYDIKENIALLEATEDVYLSEGVELYEIKPAFGDTIKIYGYSKEAGESFQMIERKMSGAERGYYKIDDSIDQGYAGGGAFNEEGEFIGIPLGSHDSSSSLGYIMPNKGINDFLGGYTDTEKYETNEEAFIIFMKNMNEIDRTGKISNEYFTFDSYRNLGLSVKDIALNSKGHGSYTLVSESGKTTLVITIPSITGKTYFTFSGNIDELEKSYRSVKLDYNIEENGKIIEEKTDIEGAKNANGTIDENIAVFGYRYNGIEYMVRTEDKNMDREAFEGAKQLYWKNFQPQKKNTGAKQNQLEVYSGSFILPDGTYAIVECGNRCSYDVILSGKEKMKVTSFSNKMEEIKGRGLKDILKQTEKMYSLDPLDANDFKILKNKNDHFYIFTRTKNQKGENELSAIFYAKESEEKYSEYEFTLTTENENLEAVKKFFELIHTLSLTLESPFPNESVSEDSEGIEESIVARMSMEVSNSTGATSLTGVELSTVSGEIGTIDSEITPLASDEVQTEDTNENILEAPSIIIE